MSYDRTYPPRRPHRNPKPRPQGYRQPQGGSWRPSSPPRRRDKSAGPAVIAPRIPDSRKQSRRMLKAAAWRLAKLIHVRPAEVIAALGRTRESADRLYSAFPGKFIRADRRGDAGRLADKIARLLFWRDRTQ